MALNTLLKFDYLSYYPGEKYFSVSSKLMLVNFTLSILGGIC